MYEDAPRFLSPSTLAPRRRFSSRVCYIRASVQRRVIILTSLKSFSSSSALPGSEVMRNTSREVTATAAAAVVSVSAFLLRFLPLLFFLLPPSPPSLLSLSLSLSSSDRPFPLFEQSFITAHDNSCNVSPNKNRDR